LAADRQVTHPAFNFEFEHTEKKIDPLASSFVMTVGDRSLGFELTERTRETLGAGAHTIRRVAEALQETFMAAHLRRAEKVILHPYSLTFAEFKDRAPNIPAPAFQEITGNLWRFGVDVVEFLVCGVDSSGGHIFRVHYNGVIGGDWLEWCDGTGFRAAGAGGVHATISLSLAGQHRGCPLTTTLYNVYAAKRDAEAAPGVGPTTDMLVVSSISTKVVDAPTLESLDSIWKAKRQARRVTESELESIKVK
jgi:hypothetical protein